jgi:hypothetical protein
MFIFCLQKSFLMRVKVSESSKGQVSLSFIFHLPSKRHIFTTYESQDKNLYTDYGVMKNTRSMRAQMGKGVCLPLAHM